MLCVSVRDLSLDFFFFFKQNTAYEMRISDWSSDVCSSDLAGHQYGGREARHKPRLHIGDDQRRRQHEPRRRKQRRDDPEEQDRPLDAIEREDRAQDAPAVAIGAELTHRPFGPRTIGGDDLRHRHGEFQSVDADLRLDLETGGQDGEALDEPSGKDAVTRQNIGEAASEKLLQQAGERPVAEEIGRATSELQSLMRTSYALFFLNKNKTTNTTGATCT